MSRRFVVEERREAMLRDGTEYHEYDESREKCELGMILPRRSDFVVPGDSITGASNRGRNGYPEPHFRATAVAVRDFVP